jgi:Tol biopolymer transport system component
MTALLPVVWLVAAAVAQDGSVKPPTAPPSGSRLEVKETSLGTIKGVHPSIWSGEPGTGGTLTVSPDGNRIGYVVLKSPSKGWMALAPFMVGRSGTAKVVVDGVEGPEYEGVGMPVFSPDSRRVAYRAMHGGKFSVGTSAIGRFRQMVVVDGVEGPAYEEVGEPLFSPDSQHIAYGASVDRRPHMIVDGAPGAAYDRVTFPVFSPDSRRVAYIAWQGKEMMLVDGAEVTALKAIDGAHDLAFSPDGRRLVYAARRGKQSLVGVNGVPGPAYDEVGVPVFSSDGRLAYAARRGDAAFLLIEPEPRESTPYVRVGNPVFSPDGRRLAYWVYDGKQEHVVLDGVAGKPYDGIGKIVFGPDSQHLAYEASIGNKWHGYKFHLVVDDVDGPEYAPVEIGNPREWRHMRRGWVFSGPDRLRYFRFRKDTIVRSEVQITSAPPSPQ